MRALKGLGKRFAHSTAVRRLICAVVAFYIWILHKTGRWTVHGGEIPARFWAEGKPFILAFWHGRLLMVPPFWSKDKTLRVLISHHRDGELISRSVAHFGLESIRGSSSKGGASAMRAMLRGLRGGDYVAITPDGPRGPRMRASDGIVKLAARSGVPVIPASYSADSAKALGSWDRFLLGVPFTRGVFMWGEPIDFPRDLDADGVEQGRLLVERRLNELTAEADRLCGRAGVEPADQPAEPV